MRRIAIVLPVVAAIHDEEIFVNLADLELPERASSQYQPMGPRCEGVEDPPGFYSDGLP